jgi:hypothetical protein
MRSHARYAQPFLLLLQKGTAPLLGWNEAKTHVKSKSNVEPTDSRGAKIEGLHPKIMEGGDDSINHGLLFAVRSLIL